MSETTMNIEGQTATIEINVKATQTTETREQWLAKYPVQTEWVKEMEGYFGPFLATSCLRLHGERLVMAIRFERGWHWLFINPEKGEDAALHVNLSPEAMCAFVGLFEFIAPQELRDRDWDALIASLEKAGVEKETKHDPS